MRQQSPVRLVMLLSQEIRHLRLTCIASDPDPTDVLSYCWEQMDNAVATMPPVATSTDGPNFRSNSPTTNPTRYFPNLADLAAGVNPTWEVLASVTRNFNFRVTVRDNSPGAGCTDEADIIVGVDGNSGPFLSLIQMLRELLGLVVQMKQLHGQ